MGGCLGKDFGSINMDELLKNIWSAEEIQSITSIDRASIAAQSGAGTGGGGAVPLQRQGSLTLPRKLSQKTVDEVWRDISKERNGAVGASLPQRQQTLGEMTLEEFLLKARVVREDNNNYLCGKQPPNGSVFFGNNIKNASLGIGAGLKGKRITETSNILIPIQAMSLLLNFNGMRSNRQQHEY